MNLEVTLGHKKLHGTAAQAVLDDALDETGGEDVDALWWREGREGPYCVLVVLPKTKTGRYRAMNLSHASWPQLRKDLKALGLVSEIQRDEVKVTVP